MKNLLILPVILFFLCPIAEAQQTFTLDYSLANWTTTLTPGSTGSINYSDAPNSVTVIGSDGARLTNAEIDFTIAISAPGVISFDWEYFTNDATATPRYDVAGVLINGAFTQLNTNAGNIYQTGHYSSGYLTAGTVIGFRVRSVDNLYGNAIFRVAAFSSPMFLLPVDYNYFTGQAEGHSVKLRWGTEKEENCDYFDVERSSDGRKFHDIARIESMGTVSAGADYITLDTKPFAGTNYYRLKQADVNGSISYSKTIKVNKNTGRSVRLYPNPARDYITIHFGTGKTNRTESVKLYDASGKLLQKRTLNLQTAGNSILTWNISAMAPGVYFLSLENDAALFRFIKQ